MKPQSTRIKHSLARAAWKAWDWFELVIAIMQSGNSANPFPKELARSAIIEFLSNGLEAHVNEIKKYVMKRTGVSQAIFYNALNLLLDAGKLVKSRPDYYKLVKKEDEKIQGEKK